eukprot:TRINITY_DN3900_c0_g1_i1.p1 TRINITY_DN3900_c0_g1~~TRINITY_DN3900_c0_g1_i1.p1  ORF type:complete len:623 (-),score=109.22 TRINITY_DN3900_c0_g1_i1:193-1926(-)
MEDELGMLVLQQQRELMAAKALESDLDLAFKIQMQEALTASLLPNASSSSSSSSSSSFPPISSSSDVPHHLHLIDKEDETINPMHLQTLELERFQQERKDRALCESERRRVAFDLKRRIHDQAFASEIHQMPAKRWAKCGDIFEKPIVAAAGRGSSSSSSSSASAVLETGEPFRLYFKGLVSTEQVNGLPVSLAGMGIAVCDPRDNLLLRIQKPLLGAGFTQGIVEMKALIEGLQAVISLDIKDVDVFFDFLPLFNQVNGTWVVKQKRLANLLNQVYPLQRKIQNCRLNLLPRSNVKFAFKLARDAIDCQISRNIESTNKNLKETCTICLEDTDISQIFVVDGCLHRYCVYCMNQHVEVQLLNGVLPGCPGDNCHTKLNVDSSRKFLSPRLIEIMAQRIREASIPEADRLYCPFPKCSVLMSRKEMMRPREQSSSRYQAAYNSGLRKCAKCDGLFCINCKVPWHGNLSCNDYKRFNPNTRAEDAKLKSLARQQLWRQCMKCNHMIELAEGCYHMTCRCGNEFCYTCGAEWINKKATCACPLWHEANILHNQDEDDDSGNEDNEADDGYNHNQPRLFY